MNSDSFRQKVLRFMLQEGMLREGMRIVTGLSGGADSLGLLFMLSGLREEWKLELTAVHVHHGIREEADEDVKFCRDICERCQIPLIIDRADIPALAEQKKLSLEEAGRDYRYALFERIRACTRADVIAVAHHMDDQAETILMHLFRGSGITGASGMLPVRGTIIRPFLGVRKCEIESWLEEQALSWCRDQTNTDTSYERNRIRNKLIPEIITDYNEKAIEHLSAFSSDIQQADAFLREAASDILETEDSGKTEEASARQKIAELLIPHTVSLPLKKMEGKADLLKRYLVRECIARTGCSLKDLSRGHIEAILQLMQKEGSKSLDLPGELLVWLEYDRLAFRRNIPSREKNTAAVRISIFEKTDDDLLKKIPQNSCVNWFDYDKINGSLCLRHRLQGDWISVGDGRRKRLKEYLIDAKMPAKLRDSWPILASGHQILWVPGYRCGEDCRVGPDTGMILSAELVWNTEKDDTAGDRQI